MASSIVGVKDRRREKGVLNRRDRVGPSASDMMHARTSIQPTYPRSFLTKQTLQTATAERRKESRRQWSSTISVKIFLCREAGVIEDTANSEFRLHPHQRTQTQALSARHIARGLQVSVWNLGTVRHILREPCTSGCQGESALARSAIGFLRARALFPRSQHATGQPWLRVDKGHPRTPERQK